MHHAGAQDLDPALAVAGGAGVAVDLTLAFAFEAPYVHLAGGLGEGEMVGAEADHAVLPVEELDHLGEAALQIRHGDALVDDQSLHLMEHGAVGGVHLVLPVDPAGGDDADGGLPGLHDPDLHGRGLGPQKNGVVLGGVEGVLPVPGGMARGGIELGEVVALQLHLRAVHHVKAHADEDLLHLIEDDGHGMLVAQRHLGAGHGHVQRLGAELQVQGLGGQLLLLLLQILFNGGADLVGHLAHHRPLLRAQGTHHLQYGGEFALFAQEFHPQGLQLRGVRRGGEGFQRFFLNGFQLLLHSRFSFYINVLCIRVKGDKLEFVGVFCLRRQPAPTVMPRAASPFLLVQKRLDKRHA